MMVSQLIQGVLDEIGRIQESYAVIRFSVAGIRLSRWQLLPDRPYRIRAFGTEYVVFPSRYFNDIKRIPAKDASAYEFFRHAFHTDWSGIPRHSEAMMKAVAVDGTRAIPSLIRDRQHDCAAACDVSIGECPEWTEITMFPALQKIVVSTNASPLVGKELASNPTWISHVERLPMLLGIPTVILSLTPAVLRPLLKPLLFVPIQYSGFVLTRLITPVLKEDMLEFESTADKKSLAGPKAKGKLALTSWLLGRYPASVKDRMSQLIRDYLAITFESTPSTSGALFYILIELAAAPELAETVRQELREVAPNGELPSTHLNELKIMDSVMRESARVNPFSHLVLYRKLLSPLKLEGCPELPAGCFICVDAHHIDFSPQLWEDPERFDGLRHYRARQKPENGNRFKFANLGPDAPGWGDGPQACPGRMFADNTLKIILAHILTHYDLELPPGQGKPEKGSMPNGSMSPDTKAKVLFRSRKL
uniref:P450 oxygenase n=1 Tax=Chaetomium globosum TaxID=38033 RepID=A0A6B9NZ83_CHAGS|nr:P450 oxygenase [Chaetomium globosum]